MKLKTLLLLQKVLKQGQVSISDPDFEELTEEIRDALKELKSEIERAENESSK